MMVKRYCNPLGEFNWMGRKIPKFIKTVIMSGLDMLRTMGMSQDVISDELKEYMERGKEGKPYLVEESNQVEKEKVVLSISKKSKETIKVSD